MIKKGFIAVFLALSMSIEAGIPMCTYADEISTSTNVSQETQILDIESATEYALSIAKQPIATFFGAGISGVC